MKPTIITSLLLLLFLHSNAQSNFYKIGIGGGVGYTQSYTDVAKHSRGVAGYGVIDYFFTPFLSLGGEGQMGQIAGGDIKTDVNNRQFVNDYKAVSLNGKLYLGGVLNYDFNPFANAIKGLYVGSGIGIMQNKLTAIVRKQPGTGYIFPGTNASREVFFPLNLWINFYFPDHLGDYRYVVNVNFQGNVSLGEGMDGYDDSPIKFKNTSPDIYSYFSVGFRYNIGPIGLSQKTFRRP